MLLFNVQVFFVQSSRLKILLRKIDENFVSESHCSVNYLARVLWQSILNEPTNLLTHDLKLNQSGFMNFQKSLHHKNSFYFDQPISIKKYKILSYVFKIICLIRHGQIFVEIVYLEKYHPWR